MGKKCILITTAKLNIRALFIAGDIEEGRFFPLCPRWPDTIWQFWTLSANPKYAFHNTNWQLIMCIWWLCLSSTLPIGDQEIFFNFKPSLVLACAWSWSRGGASHRTLVPLHLPLLGFCFFSFFVCVLYYKCILYITRVVPNKAVEKKIHMQESETILWKYSHEVNCSFPISLREACLHIQ